MLELLEQEIIQHGERARIVPVSRLHAIRQDIQELKDSGTLNDFQRYIVSDLYQLGEPGTDFEVRSILIVASPSPASAKITFTWNGKRIPLMVPAAYVDNAATPARIERYLRGFLDPRGYHIQYAPRLPRKLLAVRSGLGLYGRNNICYVEGMGSFLNLAPYVSDIPPVEDCWHEIRHMDICHTCHACLDNCPTVAITQTRFLIDNERCLTYFNEAAGKEFPEWIDPSVHHALYGCSRCQAVCPVNRHYLANTIEPAEFTEEETSLLFDGESFECFPESLKQKIDALDMKHYLGALPRNLRVLFAKDASHQA
jgi:epoxyqueuosine reductase